MGTFGRMFGYVLRYKAGLGLAFLLAVLSMLFELARPWPVKVIVDYALTSEPWPQWLTTLSGWLPGATQPGGLIVWSVIALALVAVGVGLAAYVGMVVTVGFCYHMVYDLACDLFAKLQRLSQSYHQRQTIGDLMQRMSGDVFVVHYAVSGVMLPVVISLLNLLGMFTIMLLLDPLLASVALAVVPALVVSLLLFAKPMDRATSRRYERQASMMALVEQSLTGVRIIQGFAREAYLQAKMQNSAGDLGDAYNRDMRIGSAYQQTTLIITGVGTAFVLGIGAWRVSAGFLTLGDLLVFLGYLAALYGPVSAVSMAVGAAVATNAQARRVFDVIDSKEEVPQKANPIQIDQVRGQVIYENVSFGYAGGEDHSDQQCVLHDISFQVDPGQIIAVVGATGVGKSTLVALLSRFYDPWQGRVLLDGHDVRDLDLAQLRQSIALVLQEPFLFPISIAENITFGRPNVTREMVIEAARTAQAHEFISRLPAGYDTVLGERGATLSGGERQRIAIARALVGDSPILVLDEPTSAVDARTEAEILRRLAETSDRRTTFVISHRLSTIRRADQIIVLENGRIVERGRHEQLIDDGAIYSRLYKHQELAML
ncbi:MAG: ABC transporter ATP-binding protein [Phycisphaeraceae bacterium]|nr:ABC transporter ATP-binding protein [Phycisphaeraceae bacterium]